MPEKMTRNYLLESVGAVLLDTVHINEMPMSTPYTLFTNPVGMREPGAPDGYKTWLHTNMVMGAQLPSPNQFLATRLNVLFLQDGVPLRLWDTDLYAKTQIDFTIMDKRYWNGPAWTCCSPFALFEAPDAEIELLEKRYGIRWQDTAGTLLHYDQNKPELHAQAPLDIGTQESFYVRAHVYDRGPRENLQLACHIDGTQLRSVV